MIQYDSITAWGRTEIFRIVGKYLKRSSFLWGNQQAVVRAIDLFLLMKLLMILITN